MSDILLTLLKSQNSSIFINNVSDNFVFKGVEKSKINDFTNSLIFRQTMPTMASFNAHLNESIDIQGNNLKMMNNELNTSFSISLTWLPYQINGENVLAIKKIDEKIDEFLRNLKLISKIKTKSRRQQIRILRLVLILVHINQI